MDILAGLLIGIIGLTVAFMGLRVFFAMLPMVGFIVGFFAGATLISSWLGEGFLATMTGWLVGFVIGIAFALISYLWWYAGALVTAGASGALLFSGLFSLIGIHNGFLLTTIAVAGAVVFVIGALVLNLPIYVVLVNSAIVGAYGVVGGLLLLLNAKDLSEFDWGVARVIAHESFWWWIVWIAVAVAGMMSQMQMISRVTLPEEKWTRIEV